MPGHLLDAPCGSVYPGRGQLTCAIAVGHGGLHSRGDIQWAAEPPLPAPSGP